MIEVNDESVLDYGIHEAEVNRAIVTELVKPVDLKRVPLEIAVENIDQVEQEEFALVRRKGFGGSDSAVLLGVSPFKTLNELIKQKATDELSEEERNIGKLASVRKGNDTEALSMQKASALMGLTIFKPPHMYRFTEFPFLTMNFDGVTEENKQYVPVEIKYVTSKGAWAYNKAKAIKTEYTDLRFEAVDVSDSEMSIEDKAKHYGLPVYYYTQLQQEMMALDAPYGYLAALFEDDWTLRVYWVPRDAKLQNQLVIAGDSAYRKVEKLRGTAVKEEEEVSVGDYV